MREALIISPFATWPLDAGHRRRAMQMTAVLANAGYRITFLFLAFEDPWHWSHDPEGFARLREQWDNVILVYAGRHVGLPPAHGPLHNLDEWWDPALESVLANIADRRHFDVAVVHNVWLSKAFDFLPRSTFKILETHDLFWKRQEVFDRMRMKPEFFITSEEAELFGVQRADVAVTIQAREGAELLEKSGRPVITVPFYDETLEITARSASPNYRSLDKVTFGTLATANPFNIVGLRAFLAALEEVVAETFAPVEVIVGGRVGEHLKGFGSVKRIGYVESEAAFYATVDFAIAPVFDGTGFKVKAADALALRMPTLLSGHAAEGIEIDPHLVCQTPEIMARRMTEIAMRRPPLTEIHASIRRARHELRGRAREASNALLSTIASETEPLVIDLSSARLASDCLALQSYLCNLRSFSAHFPVILLAADEVLRLIGKCLPLGVKAMTHEGLKRGRIWPRLTVIDVFGIADRDTLGLTERDLLLFDQRWHKGSLDKDPAFGVLGALPLFHPNLSWEPAVLALRSHHDRHARTSFNGGGRRVRFVYVDDRLDGLERLDLDHVTANFFISVADWESFQTSTLMVLNRSPAEVVWAARPYGVAHRAVLEGCGMKRIPFHGWVDAAILASGERPDCCFTELQQTTENSITWFREHVTRLRSRSDDMREMAYSDYQDRLGTIGPRSEADAVAGN